MAFTNEPSIVQAAENESDDLVDVGWYPTSGEGFERGLVVLASGAAYWLVPDAGGFRLRVEAHAAAEVSAQLLKFERENAAWPPRVHLEPHGKAEWFTPLLWAGATIAGYWAQGRSAGWTEAGAVDAGAMFERGELWRAVTALFLHADAAHLTANLVGGIAAFGAVLSTVGRARGWLLIAISAVIGNLAAAALQMGTLHRSIGASTAVFAALGLLVGRAVRARRSWRAALLPLATGLVVLGLYGAGEQRVDVLAHVTGFCAGVLAGVLAGRARREAAQPD